MEILKSLLSVSFIILSAFGLKSADLLFEADLSTGALSKLTVAGDTTGMNWIISADGTQYDFIGDKYGWGLGYFSTSGNKEYEWHTPLKSEGGMFVYKCGEIQISVKREPINSEINESYTFENTGNEDVEISDIGIYTPFNDNYPNSLECINRRCNAHIWSGGNSAYVCAMRMGGFGTNVGLVLTDGYIEDYEIWERGLNKQHSQLRGVIALCPRDFSLKPGECKTIAWTLFPFSDKADFIAKATGKGCVIPESSGYVMNKGDTVSVNYGDKSVIVKAERKGEMRVGIPYGNGKFTFADFMVFENIDSLINRRADFIVNHQRMADRNDERCGAFMVYDNDTDSIYLNDRQSSSPVDRDEGAERVGMGVFLAKHHIANGERDKRLEEALVDYASFLRNRLQTEDFTTYSSVDRTNRNRAYNYVWISEYYFLMHEITGVSDYAIFGYNTLRAMCRQFGHGFYAIGFPVVKGLDALDRAGLVNERDSLLKDFELIAETYANNGVNYPPFEVNYEQSIVAPAVQLLCQMYIATGDRKYLTEAERHIPVMEAFNGFQPSYHLNDIAIRHWDGYWFGKREMFGDTFPHYWSTITASSLHLYALCTGNHSYQKRAVNIVRNNLCLFTEEGRASCAYLYPKRVNGVPAKFYDSYANDQDWALAYWYEVMKGL